MDPGWEDQPVQWQNTLLLTRRDEVEDIEMYAKPKAQ
jgi:hypothetical protein